MEGKARVTDEDNLKEHLLVNLHELQVPLVDIRCLLASIIILLVGLDGVVPVVFAPLDDLPQHRLVHLERELASSSQQQRR